MRSVLGTGRGFESPARTQILTLGAIFYGHIRLTIKQNDNEDFKTNRILSEMMGTTQEYFIKGGNYKSSTNGTFAQWQIYINNDNKLYNKMANSPTILWNDGAVNADEVVQAEINKGVIDILGHKCDELVLTCKSGVQKYYFSTKFKVDPKLFEKHKFGNWNEVISRTSSIPLKMTIDNPQFTLECLVTEILPMKLDDKVFQLPADSKVEKSPY